MATVNPSRTSVYKVLYGDFNDHPLLLCRNPLIPVAVGEKVVVIDHDGEFSQHATVRETKGRLVRAKPYGPVYYFKPPSGEPPSEQEQA